MRSRRSGREDRGMSWQGIRGVGRGMGGRVAVELSASAKRMPTRLQSSSSGDVSLANEYIGIVKS